MTADPRLEPPKAVATTAPFPPKGPHTTQPNDYRLPQPTISPDEDSFGQRLAKLVKEEWNAIPAVQGIKRLWEVNPWGVIGIAIILTMAIVAIIGSLPPN